MFLKKIIIFILFFSFVGFANAEIKIETTTSNIIIGEKNIDFKEVKREDIFIFLGDYIIKDIPKSYKYIKLNFKGINKNTKIYNSLQKLVYLDILENKDIKLGLDKKMKAVYFYKFIEKIIKIDFLKEKNTEDYIKNDTKLLDLKYVFDTLNEITLKPEGLIDYNHAFDIRKKFRLFFDVYETLNTGHYNREKISKETIIEQAILGLTKGIDDKFTTYFPPVEKKSFFEHLNGEYEGIGAYVDMEEPGVLKIVTPMVGSPAEKAGLKGGDIVVRVDDKEITETNTLTEIVSWIKGKAGTKVLLYIKRGNKSLQIEVTRGKINIEDIESEKIDRDTYYIKIKVFGDKVASEFKEQIDILKNDKNIKKVIIDLRNNPGGFLERVADMLGYFIPYGENVAVVKYLKGEKEYKSVGYDMVDFSDKKIVILINSGSASASEIMAGTIKDYYPNSVIIGEKSYGKGSVQTIKSYYDGSSLKYTIAKWFTGKTETGIDGIGIIPDIELEFDKERFDKTGYDNQLEKAKSVK